jgi:D-xylose transport system ATP-binding protein
MSIQAVASGTVLSLKNVSKNFGAVAALTDVELDIKAGEVVALVGDNGAGKSTLVKILAGVHPQDVGIIKIASQEVHLGSPSDSIKHGIATVFQDLALCDNLDVVQNLYLGRQLRGHRLDEVTMETTAWELIRQLRAKIPSVRIPIASLSGGQRQSVAIARSLLGNPKLIMLDEPTAALLNLIERLRDRGLAVILISHNMDDIFAVADRIAVLRLGRNNGIFSAKDTSRKEVIEAITGSVDNAVTQRAQAHSK